MSALPVSGTAYRPMTNYVNFQEETISSIINRLSTISDEERLNFFTNNRELFDSPEMQTFFLAKVKQEISQSQENRPFLSILTSLAETEVSFTNYIITDIVSNLIHADAFLANRGDLDISKVLPIIVQGETYLAKTFLDKLTNACKISRPSLLDWPPTGKYCTAVKILSAILGEDAKIPFTIKENALNLFFEYLLSEYAQRDTNNYAAGCLGMIVKVNHPLVSNVLEGVVNYLKGGGCFDTRNKVAEVLYKISETENLLVENALDKLFNSLLCPQVNTDRTRAKNALGGIAETETPLAVQVLNKLTAYLRDSQVDTDVKICVTDILERIAQKSSHPFIKQAVEGLANCLLDPNANKEVKRKAVYYLSNAAAQGTSLCENAKDGLVVYLLDPEFDKDSYYSKNAAAEALIRDANIKNRRGNPHGFKQTSEKLIACLLDPQAHRNSKSMAAQTLKWAVREELPLSREISSEWLLTF